MRVLTSRGRCAKRVAPRINGAQKVVSSRVVVARCVGGLGWRGQLLNSVKNAETTWALEQFTGDEASLDDSEYLLCDVLTFTARLLPKLAPMEDAARARWGCCRHTTRTAASPQPPPQTCLTSGVLGFPRNERVRKRIRTGSAAPPPARCARRPRNNTLDAGGGRAELLPQERPPKSSSCRKARRRGHRALGLVDSAFMREHSRVFPPL